MAHDEPKMCPWPRASSAPTLCPLCHNCSLAKPSREISRKWTYCGLIRNFVRNCRFIEYFSSGTEKGFFGDEHDLVPGVSGFRLRTRNWIKIINFCLKNSSSLIATNVTIKRSFVPRRPSPHQMFAIKVRGRRRWNKRRKANFQLNGKLLFRFIKALFGVPRRLICTKVIVESEWVR